MCSPTKVALVMPISVLASEMTDRRCCVVTALETPYVPLPTMSLRVSFRPAARDNCRSSDSWKKKETGQNHGMRRKWKVETRGQESKKKTFSLLTEDSQFTLKVGSMRDMWPPLEMRPKEMGQ